MKFKVGDIIVGNDKNRYGITRKGNGKGRILIYARMVVKTRQVGNLG